MKAEDIKAGDVIALKVLKTYRPLGSQFTVAVVFDTEVPIEKMSGYSRTICFSENCPIILAKEPR